MEPLLKALIGGAAHAPDDPATEPEMCVFLGLPYRLAFLEKENLVSMINASGVYTFDATSGAEIWHRLLETTAGQRGATFGKRQVLGWSEQEVFLLDAATGRETWARRDDRCGPMQSAILSQDESQVVAACERGCILYAVAGRSQRVLPRPADGWLCGWLSSNKTLLFVQPIGNNRTTGRILLMDTESGAVTTGCEAAQLPSMFSALGQSAEAAAGGETDTALTIRDARTGKAVREFKAIPGRTKFFFWLRDLRRLFSVTSDSQQARVVDAETGMVQFSLSREGHRFTTHTPFEDALGNAWIFSQDEANNWYVWPLLPDAAPRKVLDGGRIAPGGFELHVSDPCYVVTTCRVEDGLLTHAAYTLPDMRKTAEWRVRIGEERGWFSITNQHTTHCVRSYRLDKDDGNWQRNMGFNVYVQENETPVYTGRGRPIATSPDGRFLAVQTGNSDSCVCDIESGQVAAQFSAPPHGDNYIYMTAAFSDDGRRVVFNTTESIDVMDLVEGYPRWPLNIGGDDRLRWGHPCLSSDGTRVLCGGGGCAGLFDAGTGNLLHTFEETERFVRPGAYGNGFWNTLARTAEDWVGTVTDRFKSGGYVEAVFADGGARVITHAAGQIIRVWDADSGKLLHTIHTGLPEKRNKDGWIDNRIVLSDTGRFAFCHNASNYGLASLWSLADGTLQRRYQLPERENTWPQAAPTDDGTAVYIASSGNLCRWPGARAQGN